MTQETMYITLRIDFEHDGRMNQEEVKEYAACMVTDCVNTHTIDSGMRITGVENCGENV